ncbi:DUF4301 family protein [candidate division GN15 bacterium]|nr:DUF4301 family protein [candidate division GN15 bacterium]
MALPRTEIDLSRIAREHDIPESQLRKQIQTFENGVPYTTLDRPATLGDGIIRLTENQATHYEQLHDQAAVDGRLSRFIPASGAASRMFKQLQAIANDPELNTRTDIEKAAAEGNTDAAFVTRFFEGLTRFAFYDRLCEVAREQDVDIEKEYRDGNWQRVLEFVLGPEGLNYAGAPKGLILFHQDQPRNPRTAFQEQLLESTTYTADSENTVYIHFTVAHKHHQAIEHHLNEEANRLKQSGFTLDISTSEQKRHSDTIAVTPDNTPFVDDDGNVVFRPGGHGALLENLQEYNADIVFIKNIDNVLPANRLNDIVPHKKRLGGVLIEIQREIFNALERLENNDYDEPALRKYTDLAARLGSGLPDDWSERTLPERATWLIDHFNRPLRVCGMVKNEGEPGGGPFWVRHEGGATSLQIVESAQVDPDSEEQQKIFESATHFNPVDMVCGLRNRRGKPFNLSDYVDPETALIAHKSKDGRDLKALELPGLWNGSMAFWNTVFIEVPAATFNPVKNINDLLRPAHQAAE